MATGGGPAANGCPRTSADPRHRAVSFVHAYDDRLGLAVIHAAATVIVIAVCVPIVVGDPPALFRNVFGYGGVNDGGLGGVLRAFWMVKLADRGVGSGLLEAESAAGGGSLPERGLRTWLLALDGPASRLATALRRGDPPVLARIEADRCCIDPRTVLRGEDETLVDCLEAAAALIRR